MPLLKLITLGCLLFSLVLGLGIWSAAYVPPALGVGGQWRETNITNLESYLTQMGDTWDSRYYTIIAEHGYTVDPRHFAFFPLYPMEIRAFKHLTGVSYAAATILTGALNFILFLLVFYLFVAAYLKRYFPAGQPLKVILTAVILPFTFFLYLGYTESLFNLFLYGALYVALFKRDTRLVIILPAITFFLALTRSLGAFIVVPLGVIVIYEIYTATRGITWRPIISRSVACLTLACVTAGLGIFSFMSYGQAATGNLWISRDIQKVWHRGQTWNPVHPIITNLEAISDPGKIQVFCITDLECRYALSYTLIAFGIIAGLIVLVLYSYRRGLDNAVLVIFSVIAIYLPLTSDSYSSVNRYLLSAPVYLVLLPVWLHCNLDEDWASYLNLALAMFQAFGIVIYNAHYWIV